MFENVFETVNAGFAQALYEDFLRDPSSVPEQWRALFESGLEGEAATQVGRREDRTGGKTEQAGRQQEAKTGNVSAAPEGSEPITGPALRLLKNMEASLELPTATSFRDIDVSKLWGVRAAMNTALKPNGLKLSFTHLMGWAIVQAAKRFPVMSHAVLEHRNDQYRFDPQSINLGLAVDLEGKDGKRRLMVPVIKASDRMAFGEFYDEYERLVKGVRENKLLPDAYIGGTMTLTNPGTLGTVASVPRLMKGQGSIVATGAIRTIAGARVMTVTSTYDHRIIQGAESGLFLQYIDNVLQGEDEFFQAIARAMEVDVSTANAAAAVASVSAAPTARSVPSMEPDTALLYHVAGAMSVVKHHRTHGYLAAQLDPLGTVPRGDPALDPGTVGLTPELMQRIPAAVLRTYVGGETMLDVLPRLKETYCGTIAYEIEHIASAEERVWLRRVIESGEHRYPLTDDEKRKLLKVLAQVESLEQFLHKNYLGHKRFGIEGLDMLVPTIHRVLDFASDQGAAEAVLGMAHRGRLNVLTHILGVPYETLLAEFEGGRAVEETLAPVGGTGDVKYHHGASGTYTTWGGRKIDITLMPNPSHLEAVDPVVVGSARARQTDRTGKTIQHDPTRVIPILVHGDAAFAAQGVVAETLNLARLRGYSTGGTIHIIANNQIGFTTEIRDSRSTDFASDLAKGFDVPIIHVNADDAEAGLAAVRLAMMYREKFAGDVVINLVGYRRHGHNEGDEPRYTQPMMYRRIDNHDTVWSQYAARLVEAGVLSRESADAELQQVYEILAATLDRLKADITGHEDEGEEPDRISDMYSSTDEPDTAIDHATLVALNDQLLRVPEHFRINRKLKRVLDRRIQALEQDGSIDWAHAEALALAGLGIEGVPTRLVGQDSERGTFSQRHLVLFDAESGDAFTPLQHLDERTAPFELHNSPLSEYAALGFEYGYSTAAPDAMILWEAQFGDFANGAEVIIDQFIIAGLAKWGQRVRLTMLLPHGYEGQGPEHSSARIERFLAVATEGNIRVANCSTPAQYFHLLRRQAKHQEIRPLIVFTPKSLLRNPLATSKPVQFVSGAFRPVLDDPTLPGDRATVTKVVLCSGKVFYDIIGSDRRQAALNVAVGRIELLYPFPQDHLATLFDLYPNLERVLWVQEEPRNMGARKWVVPEIGEILPERVTVDVASRPERSSPAEGYPAAHKLEQERLVAEALA
ncbi:MAG: multifunctional oxoglutarate decarboxylase/oxoglutarate dehydrogenase thiamine pyrophosphate-binding subunit/dihydrolipoyllysine-residue succinyltransferase subunit [Gemmatimonadales bacterium]